MMLINMSSSDDRLDKPRKLKFCSILHRIAGIYGTLVIICLLFRCGLSVLNALQDVNKYEHTATFSYFLHFLGEYDFSENLCILLLVIAEFLLYFTQYHPAKKKELFHGSVWYFAATLVLHIIIWLHANSLPMPDSWPYTVVEEAALNYRFFANVTVSPTIVYFVSYLCRMYTLRSAKRV